MRVVHLITRLIIGGAQENTLLTVEDQHRDYGDDVHLVCGPGVGPEGTLLDRAQAGGFPVHIIPELRRELHPLRDWKSLRSIVRLFRELKPDIVHTHSSKAGLLGRAAASWLRIPAIHTIHGAAFHVGQNPIAHRIYRMAERWAGRRCRRLIGVCDAMCDQYLAAGIGTPELYETVYSGMDVDAFLDPDVSREDVRGGLGFEDEHIVVGKVARLFHLKGHDDLIRAAKPVVEADARVRFLLVGDGILREQFEEQIAAAGLSGHFVFTGLVPPQAIPGLIGAMDIVAHTSLWEGLARVVVQGLIAGKPVVSYDIDGAKEVVIPGETGFLAEPGDTRRLAECLSELVADPDLRTRLGTAGRARVVEPFRHQTMTRQLREIYQRALSRDG